MRKTLFILAILNSIFLVLNIGILILLGFDTLTLLAAFCSTLAAGYASWVLIKTNG